LPNKTNGPVFPLGPFHFLRELEILEGPEKGTNVNRTGVQTIWVIWHQVIINNSWLETTKFSD
jgi:hypothetical protein